MYNIISIYSQVPPTQPNQLRSQVTTLARVGKSVCVYVYCIYSISIYIKDRCLSVCSSVRAFLKIGESDLGRIWLAQAESIRVESETVVVFLTSPTTTPIALASARARISAIISTYEGDLSVCLSVCLSCLSVINFVISTYKGGLSLLHFRVVLAL